VMNNNQTQTPSPAGRSPVPIGGSNQHRQGVNGGRNQGYRKGNRNVNRGQRGKGNQRSYYGNSFKGETEGLNGNVFQTQTESKDPTQYKRTVEALERYCDKVYGVDMRSLFGPEPEIPSVSPPTRPGADSDEVEVDAYREEIKQFVKDRKCLEKSLRALFSVIWGQCSLNVITKLSSLEELETWKENGLCDELLMAIQQILMEFEHKKCVYVTLFKQLKYFYLSRQSEHQSLHRYFEMFQVMTESIERYGGNFGDHEAYVIEVMCQDGLVFGDVTDKEVIEAYSVKARKKFLAIAFLLGGKVDLYGNLVVELENDFLKGNDFFPSTVTEAYQLMANYSQRKTVNVNPVRRQNAVGFLQSSTGNSNRKPVKGTDERVHASIQCFKCGDYGHYSDKCPKSTSLFQCAPAEAESIENDTNEPAQDAHLNFGFFQVSYSLLQNRENEHQELNENWVLLDTQSNCDIFRNKKLLSNVRKADGAGLTLHSNGGELNTHEVGDVTGYGTVWYSPDSLANILSFANVRKKFRVSMETGPSDPRPTITVFRKNGFPMRFFEHQMGLYVHDPSQDNAKLLDINDNLNTVHDYSFVNIVANLESEFSSRDIKRAKAAQKLHRRMGHPSIDKFYYLLSNNYVRNCEVTLEDAKMFSYIYGPSSAHTKGKFIRTTPRSVRMADRLQLPAAMKEFHSNVTLNIDILYVMGIPFFHSISDHYNFRTIETLNDRKYKSLLTCIQNIINVYNARELVVEFIKGDSEFECIATSILPSIFVMAAKGEHVPRVERSIRTIKEHARSIICGLPYLHYPALMVHSLLMLVVRNLNSFPSASNSNTKMSPLSLVTGAPLPSADEFAIEYGSYAQVHNASTVTNTMSPRTTGAIALYPANSHGGWFFMSLVSGKRLVRYSWTECMVTKDIVTRVHALARADNDTETPLILDSFPKDTHIEGAITEPIHLNDINQHENNNVLNAEVVINEDNNDNNDINNEEEEEEVNENAILPSEILITDDEHSNTSNEHSATSKNVEEDEQNVFETLFDVSKSNDDDKNDQENDDENKNNINEEQAVSERSNDVGINVEENEIETILNNNYNLDSNKSEIDAIDENRSAVNEANEMYEVNEMSEVNENRSESIVNELDENRSATTNEKNLGELFLEHEASLFENQDNEKGSASVGEKVVSAAKLQHAVNKYNLRKSVRKTKDTQFEKQYFNYLGYAKSHRSKSRRLNKINSKVYEQNVREELSKLKRNQRYCRNHLHRNLVGMCMTQMSAHKGIKVYGERALTAMAKEYSQLDDLSVFKPRHSRELSAAEKKSALNVIDLIKEKRCGRIKGRAVVDGRGQRGLYDKGETSSSALTLEAFISTLAIDAAEERDVATADIAGAFLKADQPDLVIVQMRGPAVSAILQANKEKYEKYVSDENGKRTIYMELQKAMYGTLTAPILWYQLLAATLVDMGFTINPYDTCVANKTIEGKQFTVCWYVDDLKLSHVSSTVVSKMISMIEAKFGQMTVTRGAHHTYLGINFEIKDKRVHINMRSYLQECIDAYGESIMCNATTPTTKQLMEIDEKLSELEEYRKDKFHHVVAKLLHISKRARLDLQVSVGFLCTRVKKPTVEDWRKLRRVLQYIRGTLNLERIVSMQLLGEIDIYIDASHGAHWDKKGQTGGCVSVGDGVIHARSSKQQINTKSSTETELVGNSDYLTYPIWIIRFLREQGCHMIEKRLHQDNESTIKMLKNGTKSCGKKSRHVDIRYFWTTDRIKEMGIKVIHCATEKMLGDFFTKPLQGSLFRNMRDVVQGLKDRSILEIKKEGKVRTNATTKASDNKKKNTNNMKSPCSQERVGESNYGTKKRVSFDSVVDLMNLKKGTNVNDRSTYASIVKSKKMEDTKYVENINGK